MPIYAYRCTDCGHSKDVLQKMSDAPITECPACGKASMVKQVTAAGFQLKGTGWYATDFRNSGTKAPAAGGDKDNGKPAESAPADSAAPAASTESAAPASTPASTPAPAT